MKKKSIITLLIAGISLLSVCACTAGSTSASEESMDNSDVSGSTITVLNYGKYIDQEVLDNFQEATGIHVKYEEYESPEEMYTKYKAGAIDYDVICTSDYIIQKLIDEGEVNEIDYSSLSNFNNIDEKAIDISSSFDPDHKYTIPYFYGTVGILYNQKMVDEEEASSWDVLWNPKYKNEIIQPNSVRDAFLSAQVRLGYSINTTDKNELLNCLDLLKEQKPLVYAYLVDETGDEMIAENAALAVLYSGEAAYAMDFNEDLVYVVPEEGSNVWVDSWFIPKTCKHQENAERFIDYLCSEDAVQLNFEYVYYASPIKSVLENQSAEERNNEAINPPADVLSRCEVYKATDEKISALYTALWQELKSTQ